jgi:hypothetical protein
MQYRIVLHAFAAAAYAIDIKVYSDILRFSHCEGQKLISWIALIANTCYSTSTGIYAMQFVAIPTNWHIITRSYGALSCPSNTMINQFHSDGRDSVCHGSPKGVVIYRVAGYSFENKKRSETTNGLDQEVANSSNEDCVGPDLVHLVDGRDYAVTNIKDSIVKEMASLQADNVF